MIFTFTDEIHETQELLAHVQSLREALQHEKNEIEDQKKLVQMYKEDLRKSETALGEKTRMEVRSRLFLWDEPLVPRPTLTI